MSSHSLTITGAVGSVAWGYHVAGSLGPWTIARQDGVRVLTAQIVEMNTVMASQRPLAFEVRHTGGVWKWPIESLQITGASLTAVLGPKEQ